MGEVHEALSEIERQLTRAAELHISGVVDDNMYEAMLSGTLLPLVPRVKAPRHIVVLKAVKRWGENELISEELTKQLVEALMNDAKPREGNDEAGTSELRQPATPTVAATAAAEASGKKRKAPIAPKLAPGQTSLFSWKGVERQRTLKLELRKQREAALRNEDFEVETHLVIRFPSEQSKAVEEPLLLMRQCPKCPKSFDTPLGLHNHMKWHSDLVKDKLFTPPRPKSRQEWRPLCSSTSQHTKSSSPSTSRG